MAIAAPVMTDSEFLEREVPALAALLVERYGERALTFASLQALKARAGNRPLLMEAWQQIGDAARHILRGEPATAVHPPAPSGDHLIERLTRRPAPRSGEAPKRADATVDRTL